MESSSPRPEQIHVPLVISRSLLFLYFFLFFFFSSNLALLLQQERLRMCQKAWGRASVNAATLAELLKAQKAGKLLIAESTEVRSTGFPVSLRCTRAH